jgi:hypothetical protein
MPNPLLLPGLADVLTLAEHEHKTWAARSAAIPAHHPRNEGDAGDQQAGEGNTGGGEQGSDGGGQQGGESSIDDAAAGAKNPDAVKNAIKAEREARAQAERAARDAAAQLTATQAELQKIQDSGKSEEQKLLDRIANLEKSTTEATQRADRAEIAREYKLPADLLTGTTRDEMKATAERLKAFVQDQQNQARSASDGLDGGARPSGGSLTREQIAAMKPEEYLARKDEVDKAVASMRP